VRPWWLALQGAIESARRGVTAPGRRRAVPSTQTPDFACIRLRTRPWAELDPLDGSGGGDESLPQTARDALAMELVRLEITVEICAAKVAWWRTLLHGALGEQQAASIEGLKSACAA